MFVFELFLDSGFVACEVEYNPNSPTKKNQKPNKRLLSRSDGIDKNKSKSKNEKLSLNK